MITFLACVAAFLLVDAAWRRRERRTVAGGLLVAALAAVAVGVAVLPNLLYLGKVAGLLAMPTGLVWLALASASALSWWRRRRRQAAVAVAAFVVFTVLGSAPLGGAMLAWLEADYLDDGSFDGGPLDAVFVLGGATALAPGGRPRLADNGDRILTTARVYHARDVGMVVTSGSTIAGIGQQRDIAAETTQILEELGVPKSAIIELPEPKNSSQEVAAYTALARERGWKRLGIVTSAWHMRRVQRLCDASGLNAEPIPANFAGGTGWDGLVSLIPNANGFRNIQRASWELLGTAVGR